MYETRHVLIMKRNVTNQVSSEIILYIYVHIYFLKQVETRSTFFDTRNVLIMKRDVTNLFHISVHLLQMSRFPKIPGS